MSFGSSARHRLRRQPRDGRRPPFRVGAAIAEPSRWMRTGRFEVALVVAVFATMCFLVLSVSPQSAEPDDGAYHASIAAVSQGHLLTLSTIQAEHLAATLNDNPAAPPNQWVEVSPGRWISEKDPGYPFLAAPFYWLGLARWAPLFYGLLACLGLFFGARRWLGSFGGLASVALYCSSGAAVAFAWRDFMPTFTDASLIAAGVGALLWATLASDASQRRRTLVGLSGFIALEMATFVRYTDVVILACATLAAVVAWRSSGPKLQTRTVLTWLASVIVFGAFVAAFNDYVYGGPLRSGYPPGEITFSLGAIGPNLRLVPRHLLQAMPVAALALIAVAWVIARKLAAVRPAAERDQQQGRDLAVAVALGGSWVAIWALYSAYTWTTDPTNAAVSDVRFYVPAIGLISILGAWLVTRVRRPAWRVGAIAAVTAILFAQGVSSFHAMYTGLGLHLHS